MNCYLLLFCVTFYFYFVTSLDLKSVEEGPCIEPEVDSSLNLLWVSNFDQYYFPIFSKYALYKDSAARSVLDITEMTEEMAERSCPMISAYGYEAARKANMFDTSLNITYKALTMVMTAPGVFDWAQQKVTDGSIAHRVRSYVTLTDNEQFIVSVSCYEIENQKTYEVGSNYRTIDQKSKNIIKEHLTDLGFNLRKTWFEPKYDNCYDLSKMPSEQIPSTTPQDNFDVQLSPGKSVTVTKLDPFVENNKNHLRQILSDSNINKKDTVHVPVINIKDTVHVPVNTGKPQGLIKPLSDGVAPTGNKTQDSIEMFFNIFRAAIDFMQNFYTNTVRYFVVYASRMLGKMYF